MVFGDGVWSVSVSGLVLSQAPAAFLWRAEGVGLGRRQKGGLWAHGDWKLKWGW